MTNISIVPFDKQHMRAVLDLTIEAWTPVFAKTKYEVPRFAYDAFYPNGWQTRQIADVRELLESEPLNIWLAFDGSDLAGFVGIRIHEEDQMGEIYLIAVAPAHQRKGIGWELMQFAEQQSREHGMKMLMVETIGDAGHKPAREAYESFGFEPWPVARYFKPV